ncbi:protein translocase SEC61 complex subunit gamma [archaeon]|jgi:protein transport protein SEC61 subunit gamma and related proteins|nr:protein translocase SEC61 complex subunit gamma [archaeon]MBT6761590.1 protein translocase SEC61 complex subunit gamma [archaeon]
METSDSNSFSAKAKRFLKQTIRVLRITKKPGKEEYIMVLKVTGIGMAIIGLTGFVVFIIKQLIF